MLILLTKSLEVTVPSLETFRFVFMANGKHEIHVCVFLKKVKNSMYMSMRIVQNNSDL